MARTFTRAASRAERRAEIFHDPASLNSGINPLRDELDDLTDGKLTPSLLSKLDKTTRREQSEAEGNVTPLVARPVGPLICTIFRCFCENCGSSHDTFGFLSRRTVEQTNLGELVSQKVVQRMDLNEVPAGVELKQQTIPFCPLCMKAE